jgi:hypothetical protein
LRRLRRRTQLDGVVRLGPGVSRPYPSVVHSIGLLAFRLEDRSPQHGEH